MDLASQDRIAALDPVWGPMGVQVGRYMWSMPSLTGREKAFLCLTNDLCHPYLGLPLQAHVQMALRNGAGPQDVREVIRHLAPYVGYPMCALAFEQLGDLETELGVGTGPGAATQDGVPAAAVDTDTPLDPALSAAVAAATGLDGEFGAFVAEQLGQRWNRPYLSTRERALICLAVDIHYQTLDESFRLHAGLALDAGADRETLRAMVRFVAEFGMTRAWRAMHALNALFDELG